MLFKVQSIDFQSRRMQLYSKLIAAGTGAFVISGAIIGSTTLRINRSSGETVNSAASDCSTVECEEHFKCIQPDGENPTCICSSGFMTFVILSDEASEKVCQKICDKSSDCKADEVCVDMELGVFCVASKDLEYCDDVRCEDPETCELVDSSPKCKCPSDELMFEIERDGTPERQCRKKCDTSSDCEADEVCKDFESKLVCVASKDLESCDGVRCEDPEACEFADSSPQCKCPLNELLIETETDGTRERRCLKICITVADCEIGTLCFDDSISSKLYCEDRDRITDCASAVECTPETECRLTPTDQKRDCLCKNRNESTEIESTESGSTRTCQTSTCEDSDGCPLTELCLIDKYSNQGYCRARGNECKPEVECPTPTKCKLTTTDKLAECLCETGFTEIEANGPQATTRTCHTQTCAKSNDCPRGELCYEDETSEEFYCTENSKGCHGLACPNNTECIVNLEGYPECYCTNGYMIVRTTISENVTTNTITCVEFECRSSSNCAVEYLCYRDSRGDQFGICSTRLKGCTGVECPSDEFRCRENPLGFAECVCKRGSTEIDENGPYATTRTCHTRPCTDSSGCQPYELCYEDEISREMYCADNTKGCAGVICPDETECFDTLEGYSECFCTKGYTTTRATTEGSTTICEEQGCFSSNDCLEEYLCYLDSLGDQSGFCSTRLKGCTALVKCPAAAEHCRLTPSGFAECLCGSKEYTSVGLTSSGTTRTCHMLACITSNDCDGIALCYKDSITEDLFCDATPTECTSKVVCPEDFHCDHSSGRPQCVCDDDELTNRPRTTETRKIQSNGRSMSQRNCYRSCTNSDHCFPGTICYRNTSFIGNGCIEDRTQRPRKCSKVICGTTSVCAPLYTVAECICSNGAPTVIKPTATGSQRNCDTTSLRCHESASCETEGAKSVCLMDPYSMQGGCIEPENVTSCDHVRCSYNQECDKNTKSCSCLHDEKANSLGICFRECTSDDHCEADLLGTCTSANICSHRRS